MNHSQFSANRNVWNHGTLSLLYNFISRWFPQALASIEASDRVKQFEMNQGTANSVPIGINWLVLEASNLLAIFLIIWRLPRHWQFQINNIAQTYFQSILELSVTRCPLATTWRCQMREAPSNQQLQLLELPSASSTPPPCYREGARGDWAFSPSHLWITWVWGQGFKSIKKKQLCLQILNHNEPSLHSWCTVDALMICWCTYAHLNLNTASLTQFIVPLDCILTNPLQSKPDFF